MRFWTTFLTLVLGASGVVYANPTSLVLTTSAPGNNPGGSVYYVRSAFDAASAYTGNIVVDVVDSVNNWTALDDDTTSTSGFVLYTFDATRDPANQAADIGGFNYQTAVPLRYNFIEFTGSSPNYTMVIDLDSKGGHGHSLSVQHSASSTLSNHAYIMNKTVDSAGITAPKSAVAQVAQANYVGRSAYSITASANYTDISADFYNSTPTTYATHTVEFYSTNYSTADTGWSSDGSTVRVATTAVAAVSVAGSANFSSSANRLAFLTSVAYDAAGNPTFSSVSTADNLNETKWVALSQWKDNSESVWYGSNTLAGAWGSSNVITAGNAIDVQFSAVDFYGNVDSDTGNYSSSNIYFLSAADSAFQPSTAFDGTAFSNSISSVAGGLIGPTSGNVAYSGCLTFYRQESIKIGAGQTAGSNLSRVDSAAFEVRHNTVDDLVFVSGNINSGTLTALNEISADGKGYPGNMSANLMFSANSIAGSTYDVRIAMLDAYQNLCFYESGSGNSIALSDNGTYGFSSNSFAHGYQSYGQSALSHPETYTNGGADITVSSNLTGVNSGIIELSGTILYMAEAGGNLQLTSDYSSDNLGINNSINLKVDMDTSTKVAYFDFNTSINDGLLMASGNSFTAGGNKPMYTHVTDVYGNLYSSDSASVTVTAGSNYVMGGANLQVNGSVLQAYRNDGSTLTTGNSLTQAAPANGLVSFTGSYSLRLDKATGTSNVTYYPYSNVYLVPNFSANTTIVNSPALTVSSNITTNVYFANSAGEPISGSNLLGVQTAGANINAYGAVSDLYGNVDVGFATNTIWLEIADGFGPSPNGVVTNITAGVNNTNLSGGVVQGTSNIHLTGYSANAMNQLILAAANLTTESTNVFTITDAGASDLGFVDSSGNFESSLSGAIVDNTAGNTFQVIIGALDVYGNSDTDLTGSVNLYSFSGNTIRTSPGGNAVTGWGTATSFGAGNAVFNMKLFDAQVGVRFQANVITSSVGTLTTTDNTVSNAFTVSANTTDAFTIQFMDLAQLNNDNMYAGMDNVLRSANLTSVWGDVFAGNVFALPVAELDGYGNVSERSGANLVLSGVTTSSENIALSGGNSLAGTTTFNGNLLNGGSTNLVLTLYGSGTSKKMQVQSTTGSNTASESPAFTIAANEPAMVNFTTTAGTWNAGANGAGNLALSDTGASEPVQGVYVGFFDTYGNPADLTRDPISGTVNIQAFDTGIAGYPTAGSNLESVVINVDTAASSTNLVNNYLYFDPDNADKNVVFSGASAAGNYYLKAALDTVTPASITTSGCTAQFAITDTTPPVVALTYPNGGEMLYPGSVGVSFTVNDTNIDGTYTVWASYDSGVTFSENISNGSLTAGQVNQTVSWTVGSNVSSNDVRLRVQVIDSTGNADEDESDADFSISPYSSVIQYIVGDSETSTAEIYFREQVYSNTGAALDHNAFSASNISFASGANVAHGAGNTSATLTFSSNIYSDNINVASVGLTSGNVSNLPSGSSAYTSASTLAASEIRQLVSGNVVANAMTASDNQAMLGLKLVGWTSNTELKKVNVQIDSVTGSVNANDFASYSTNSLTSGVSLVDSSGNAVELTSSPTWSVGSAFDLEMSETLTTNALAGSGNYNYHLYMGTSSSFSDALAKSFKLTVNSFTIIDASSGSNVEKIYIPYGTRISDAAAADTTAPVTPTVTYSANINNESSTSSYYQSYDLVIQSEAGANIHYLFDETFGAAYGTNVSGNLVSGNGYFTTSVNLISLGNSSVELTVWAIDQAGNNGNTNALSANLTKDLMGISAANVAFVFNNGTIGGNINSSTNTSASVNIALLEVGEQDADYTVTFTDGTNNVVSTGTFGSGANTIAISGLDFSSLGQGALSVNLMITDRYGNTSGAANLTNSGNWNVWLDTIAPVMGNLITVSSDNLISLAEATAGVNLGLDALDGYATINFVLSGNSGNLIRLGTNVLTTAGNFSMSNVLTDFADGAITLTANATDPNSNRSSDRAMTITLDTVSDNTTLVSPIGGSTNIGRPTLVWNQVSDAASYELYLNGNSQANLIGSTNVSYAFTSNLLDATYTWSVNVIDVAGNESTGSSDNFVVASPSDPTLLTSLTNDTVSLGGNITFNWSESDSDNQYFFRLPGSTVSVNGVLSTNSYNYAGNLVAGTYTWSVNVLDEYGNDSGFSSGNFVVNSPNAPVLAAPANGVVAIGRPSFAWAEVNDAKSYQFILGADTTGMVADNLQNFAAGTNTWTYSSNLLTDGYTWSVNVVDIYGNSSTFSMNSFSVVNPTAPVLVAPSNATVAIGRPSFAWTEVASAKTYQFVLGADTTGMVADNLQTFSAGTNTWTYSANLVADGYTWSVNVVDIYGNSSTFSMNSFSVVNPDAPVLDSPVNNARVNVSPRLQWNDVASASSYAVVINGAIVSSSETVSQYDPATLTEGNYTWSVNVTDIYGNTSVQSSDNTFQVVIPDIRYVAADHDSTSVVVEFNEDVTSATGSALGTTDFVATDLGGALSVTHSTTVDASVAKITFAAAANIDDSDSLSAAASSVKNTDGNYASTATNVLRQIAFAELVTSVTPLNYSNGTTETATLGKFKLRGWGAGVNTLNGFTYTLTATSGVVNSTDLANGANVSLADSSGTAIDGAVSGDLGLAQTFTLTSARAMSTTETREYSVVVTTESNMTPLDTAKAFKLTIASVNLTIGNSTNVVYRLAGDEATDELVLTNVTLRDPFVTASNNTFVAADNIFKVPGQTVAFNADYVSGSATYLWTQTSGNAQTINNASSNSMTVVPSEPGQFDFALSYTLGNYTITTPSVNIVVLSAQDANVLQDLISGDLTLSTNADFQATADLLAQFVGTTISSTEAASLLSATQQVLNQFEVFVDGNLMTEATFTTTQAENLVSLVDEATKELTGADLVNSEDEVLGILDDIVLLPTVSESSMVKAFNVFGTVSSNLSTDVTADEIFTTSANLSLAALDSVEDAGKKTFTADTSANTKTSVSRLYAGQANSASIDDSLGSLVSVSISSAALAEISGAEALQATFIPRTGTETFSTSSIGSAIFEVNAISRAGSVSVTNLTNPIEISIRVDSNSAFLNYTVAYFDEATGAWSDTGITDTVRPDSSGSVNFKTNHLTKFAIFTSARSVGGGGGGGGCLLK